MKLALVVLLMGLVALAFPLTLLGQVPNEGMANAIVAARKKNAALLQQYNWNSRIDIQQNGALQDLRIALVNLKADGQLQRTLLNDQPGPLPGGFIRRGIEQAQRDKLEKYVAGLSQLMDQYTLPSPGAVVDFLAGAKVQPLTTAENTTVLQVNGKNVLITGDTFAMTVDGRTLQPISIQISTTYDGDPVTVSATFKTTKAGLNHLQYATVDVATKKLSLMVHNYDYVSNQ